jgi:C4-dicarboxylate-binding protein DctP
MRWQTYLSVLAMALLGTAAAAEPIDVLVVEQPAWRNPSVVKAMDIFLQELKSRSRDSIVITKRPWNPTESTVKAVQTGGVTFAIQSTIAIAGVDKIYGVFKLPFLFEDLGAVTKFQSGKGGRILRERLKELGLTELAFIHEGMSIAAARKPLRSPTDLTQLRGYKFAAVPYNTPTADLWRKLGASVADTRPSDIIPALERGFVDSYLGPIGFLSASAISRDANIITLTRHEYIGYVLLANSGFMRSVPERLRGHIAAAAQRAQEVGNALVIQELTKKTVELSKAGAEFIPLKRNELEDWRRAASVEWAVFRKDGDARLLEMALAAGTGGGGDPCGKLNECRCPDRTCSEACCTRAFTK